MNLFFVYKIEISQIFNNSIGEIHFFMGDFPGFNFFLNFFLVFMLELVN